MVKPVRKIKGVEKVDTVTDTKFKWNNAFIAITVILFIILIGMVVSNTISTNSSNASNGYMDMGKLISAHIYQFTDVDKNPTMQMTSDGKNLYFDVSGVVYTTNVESFQYTATMNQHVSTTSNVKFLNAEIERVFTEQVQSTQGNLTVKSSTGVINMDGTDIPSAVWTYIAKMTGPPGNVVNPIFDEITLNNGTANSVLGLDTNKKSVSLTLQNLSLASNVLSISHTSNLKQTGGQLDTIQGIKITDSPQFTNLVLTGDLTVGGTTTTLNTVNTTIRDNIIVLNSNETAAVVTGTGGTSGFDISRGTGANFQLLFEETRKCLRAGFVGFTQKRIARIAESMTDNRVLLYKVDGTLNGDEINTTATTDNLPEGTNKYFSNTLVETYNATAAKISFGQLPATAPTKFNFQFGSAGTDPTWDLTKDYIVYETNLVDATSQYFGPDASIQRLAFSVPSARNYASVHVTHNATAANQNIGFDVGGSNILNIKNTGATLAGITTTTTGKLNTVHTDRFLLHYNGTGFIKFSDGATYTEIQEYSTLKKLRIGWQASAKLTEVFINSSLTTIDGNEVVNGQVTVTQTGQWGQIIQGTQTVTDASNQGALLVQSTFSPTANTGNCDSLQITPNFAPGTGVTVTNGVGVHVSAGAKTGTGTVTNGYGMYVENPTYGTNKYAARFEGEVNVATANGSIHVNNTQPASGSIKVVGLNDGNGVHMTLSRYWLNDSDVRGAAITQLLVDSRDMLKFTVSGNAGASSTVTNPATRNTGSVYIDRFGQMSINSDNKRPYNAIDVYGGVRIGSGYTTETAPLNGMIVKGNTAIATSTATTILTVNPKVIDDGKYAYDVNTPMFTHPTPTATATLNDPQPVLYLARQGKAGEAFGSMASFNLCRYENTSTNSKTRLDINLTNGDFGADFPTVMSIRSDGKVAIGSTDPGTAKLHITSASSEDGCYIYTISSVINLHLATSGLYDNIVRMTVGANFWDIRHNLTNHPLVFAYGTTENMSISTAGLMTVKSMMVGSGTSTELLSVSPDSDVSAEIGRVHIGSMGTADTAGFSHVDQNSTTNYALIQTASGQTQLNAATGQVITFNINNVEKMRLATDGKLLIGSTTSVITSKTTSKLEILGDLSLAGTNPMINFYENDEAADNKLWDNIVSGKNMLFRVVNDLNTSSTTWMTVNRSGITVPTITMHSAVTATTSMSSPVVAATSSMSSPSFSFASGAFTGSTAGLASQRTLAFTGAGSDTVNGAITITGQNWGKLATVSGESLPPAINVSPEWSYYDQTHTVTITGVRIDGLFHQNGGQYYGLHVKPLEQAQSAGGTKITHQTGIYVEDFVGVLPSEEYLSLKIMGQSQFNKHVQINSSLTVTSTATYATLGASNLNVTGKTTLNDTLTMITGSAVAYNPDLSTTVEKGEITALSAAASDNGFLRLSAGGATTVASKSAIDLQGSTNNQIKFWAGTTAVSATTGYRALIDSTGLTVKQRTTTEDLTVGTSGNGYMTTSSSAYTANLNYQTIMNCAEIALNIVGQSTGTGTHGSKYSASAITVDGNWGSSTTTNQNIVDLIPVRNGQGATELTSTLHIGGTINAPLNTIYGINIDDPTFTGTGSAVNKYGIRIAEMAGATGDNVSLRVDGNTILGGVTATTILTVNPRVSNDGGYAYDKNAPMFTHPTATATATLNDPQPVLYLARQGKANECYGSMASFKLCRYANTGTDSNTRLDVHLTKNGFDSPHIMSLRSDGKLSLGTVEPNTYKLLLNCTAAEDGCYVGCNGNVINLHSYNTTGHNNIIRMSVNTNYWDIVHESLNKALYFAYKGTEVMSLSNGGTTTIKKLLVGTGTLTYDLSVSPGSDVSAQIGRAIIGSVGDADTAGFSHEDHDSTTNYALIQTALGQTQLNAATGQVITFNINNVEKMRLATDGKLAIGSSTATTILTVNPKVIDDGKYAYDVNTPMFTHPTPTATATLNDPQPVLYLARQGKAGECFGSMASFNLCRYSNTGTNSKTRLDLKLTNGDFGADFPSVMSIRSDGKVAIGSTDPGTYKLHITAKALEDGCNIYTVSSVINLHLSNSGVYDNIIRMGVGANFWDIRHRKSNNDCTFSYGSTQNVSISTAGLMTVKDLTVGTNGNGYMTTSSSAYTATFDYQTTMNCARTALKIVGQSSGAGTHGSAYSTTALSVSGNWGWGTAPNTNVVDLIPIRNGQGATEETATLHIGGSITNPLNTIYGINIDDPTFTGTGSAVNKYGIRIAEMAGATTNNQSLRVEGLTNLIKTVAIGSLWTTDAVPVKIIPAAKLEVILGSASGTGSPVVPGTPSAWDSTYATFGVGGANGACVGIGMQTTGSKIGHLLSLEAGVVWLPMVYNAASHEFKNSSVSLFSISSTGADFKDRAILNAGLTLTENLTLSGPMTSTAHSFTFRVVDDIVHCKFAAFSIGTGTGSAVSITSTAISDTGYRPGVNQSFPLITEQGGTYSSGMMTVSSAGVITIALTPSTTYDGTATTKGFLASTVTWLK